MPVYFKVSYLTYLVQRRLSKKKKKKNHKSNSIRYSLQKKSSSYFFHLEMYVSMSQLGQSYLILMSYIERISCFAHVVYSYSGLRKSNWVLQFQVNYSKKHIKPSLILNISLGANLKRLLFQSFILLRYLLLVTRFCKCHSS